MANAEQGGTLDRDNTKSKEQEKLKIGLAEMPKRRRADMHFPSVTVLRSGGEKEQHKKKS